MMISPHCPHFGGGGSSPGRSVLQGQSCSASPCTNSPSLYLSAFSPFLLKVTRMSRDSHNETLHEGTLLEGPRWLVYPKAVSAAPSRQTEPLPQQKLKPPICFLSLPCGSEWPQAPIPSRLPLASGSRDAICGEFKRREIPDTKGTSRGEHHPIQASLWELLRENMVSAALAAN